MKSTRFFLGTAIAVGCLQVADAALFRYRQSGDWTQVTDGSSPGWGLNPNNDGVTPGPGQPGAGDTARINWGGNTVTVTSAVPTFERLQIGVDESGFVVVAAGGELTTANDLLAGNNNSNATGGLTVQSGGQVSVGNIMWAANNDADGFIDVQAGGLITVSSHLWWGVTGSATITIDGVIDQTGGILGLGTLDASTDSGGTATVSIANGGELNLNNISGAAGTPSIQAGSQIQISEGGLLTVKGNQVGTLNDYIAESEIVGVGGTPQVAYDSALDLTSVTVIPEPSALALLGVFSLGLATRRRRL